MALRSPRPPPPSSFFPWGEEQTSTPNDRVKFATYRRDSESNLDYAWNRYYNNVTARFMSPDPYGGSAHPSNPQSRNRYAYVLNDPVDVNDPTGHEACWIDGYFSDEGWNPDQWASVPGNCPGFAEFYATGFGRPGGGAPSAFVAAKDRVADDLKKPNCAKDFLNAQNDIKELAKVSLGDLGTPRFQTQDDGSVIGTPPPPSNLCAGALGCYYALSQTVVINSVIDWADPNSSTETLDGAAHSYPALSAYANYVGYQGLTAGQFLDLIILHELSHYNGARGNPDKQSVMKNLLTDCIK